MADLTELLVRVRQGEADAKAELVPLVYAELRALAGAYLRNRPNQTLQPTALVHEVYLRLVRADGSAWKDRAHFMAVAATAMRQILTDRVRRRTAGKRGGADQERVTLANLADAAQPAVDVIALDELLTRLAAVDERAARLVELRFFGGLTEEEAAEVLAVSLRTVQKDWRKAKAWLLAELAAEKA